MPAANGLVSILADPSQKAIISEAWVADVASFGVKHVRVPLSVAADGSLPTTLYATALDRYKAAGITVHGVLHTDFTPVGGSSATIFPNMPCNVAGDRLTSPYIDAVTLRMAGFARQVQAHGLDGIYAGNEYNLLGILPEGFRPPPGEKGSALAPSVAAALCWQTASRLKTLVPALAHRICGSLSLIAPSTGLDPRNPYLAEYLRLFYESLIGKLGGIPHVYPWTETACNIEGWATADWAARAIATVQAVKAKYHDTTPVVIGEWGVRGSWLRGSETRAAQNYAALQGSGAVWMDFFSHNGAVPYLGDPALFEEFGTRQWRIAGGEFIPTGRYEWYGVLQQLYATLPTTTSA